MSTTNTIENLHDYANDILKKGRDQFDHIEVCALYSQAQHIKVLDQKTEENVTSNSCSLGIRMIKDTKQMIASTSDLSQTTFDRLIENADQNISYLPEDHTNIINPDFIDDINQDLDLVDDTPWLSVNQQIKMAETLEHLSLSNPDISKSNGATISFSKRHYLHANSLGFHQSYDKNICSKMIGLVAGDNQAMQQHYEYSSKTHAKDLKSNQDLSQKAMSDTLKKLNPGTIQSGEYPIVFDPRMGSQLISYFLSAINALSIIRKTSFLQDALNQIIFNPNISISDHATLTRGLSSKPFDADGFQTQPITLIEKGRLKTWLLDYKSAHQLQMNPTRTSSRSPGNAPTPSSTNVTVDNGYESVEALISNVKTGIFVTSMMGMGINSSTGDMSQGASGFKIENGQITTPISGFTIAGNLKNIFKTMHPANDLEFERRINTPSLFIPSMTVASN